MAAADFLAMVHKAPARLWLGAGESTTRETMAKLYFHYATMNAGKSTMLLQASHNYRERGMHTLAFTSAHHASAAVLAVRKSTGVPVTAASVNSGTARSSWA